MERRRKKYFLVKAQTIGVSEMRALVLRDLKRGPPMGTTKAELVDANGDQACGILEHILMWICKQKSRHLKIYRLEVAKSRTLSGLKM